MLLKKSVRKYLYNIIDKNYSDSPSYAYSDVDLDLDTNISQMMSNSNRVIVLRIDKDSKGREFCVGFECGTINLKNNHIYSRRLSEFVKVAPNTKMRAFLMTTNDTVKKFNISELTEFVIE